MTGSEKQSTTVAVRSTKELGMAFITTLLVLMLASALMAGFFAAIASDMRVNGLDRDQTQAYAAAHAGLEKMTSALATLFVTNFSPNASQINALTTTPPAIPGFNFTAPGLSAGSGYSVSFTPDANGDPAPENTAGSNITAGPYKGFKGLITKYPITITARSNTGAAEVRLRRELQTVAVPVFQFGVFSENDLSFYAGDNFNFGGRVHTNGSLFVSQLSGRTLTFSDRITAVGEVIRENFSNGLSVSSNFFTGNVNMVTAFGSPNTYRNLRYSPNEGSRLGMPTAAPNPNWTTISVGIYKSNIRNGLTGAKTLNLPLVSQGAVPIDLIRRPVVNEDAALPLVFGQRYFSQASVRILLSDSAAEITNLPTVTATPPVQLDGDWRVAPPNNGTAYGPVDATHPPIARTIGPISDDDTLDNPATSGNPAAVPPTGVIELDDAVPVEFRLPAALTVGANTNVQCTGKTASRFTGCTGIDAAVAPTSAVSATVSYGMYNTVVTTQTTIGAIPVGQTFVDVTANGAVPFSRGFFWVNGTAPAATLVSCTGFDEGGGLHRFTGCAWSGATPVNNDRLSTNALAQADTGVIGGFIKIERQLVDAGGNALGTWADVTMEILNLGIGGPNSEGTLCADPTPNAIIRIQRLRDNGGGTCTYAGSTYPYDYWPNALFDTREGIYRTGALTAAPRLGGVMHYIALDVNNLRLWFNGTIGTTGGTSLDNNGFIVYFSDRRNDHDENNADVETGEYGFEDVVNPASATGTPNGALNTGEDANANGTLQLYGQSPPACCGVVPLGSTAPYAAGGRPWDNVTSATGRVNKPVLFRRALKLINGGINGGVNSLPPTGLTVAAENPVYVQGNYNATSAIPTANWANQEPNRPAAVIADAVTLLSNNWSDFRSFRWSNDTSLRPASTTGYRLAVVAGKSLAFPWPSPGAPHFLFGTDGGMGNFLRLLEDWQPVSINYRGSVVSLFISRQATGTFKWGPTGAENVYVFGARNFTFDDDFLLPALLPPGTPMFRDVNTLTFRQLLRPTQ